MENKRQRISNIQDKQNFPINSLSNLNNFSDDIICIKQDCMVWFDKDKHTLNYIEFDNPNEVREFNVGSEIIMIDVIDNLIICINSDYVIILYSRNKSHKKWHVRLVNEPEHENGEYFIVNRCILDNLVIISFFELLQQQVPEEENEENPENQGEFKIVVWDLNLLVEALNHKDVDESNFYDIKIGNIIIPINFNPFIVHNCAFYRNNEETGELEKYYYIMCCSASDGYITIFIYDEDLKSRGVANYKYDLEDDILLWGSVHSDGMILAIGKKEIEIFSVNDIDLEQHRKIPADVFDSYDLYDIVLTPELLYIMMFTQPQEEEEGAEGEVRLAVVDISDDHDEKKIEEKDDGEIIKPEKIKPIFTKWSDKEVCYNKLVDTGIVHYDPETKNILFTPFSKCFCDNDN